MPKGGFYKVKMSVAGKSDTNATGIFIYNAGSSTPSVEKVEAVYESTGTKTVSGITYDNGAKVKLNVTGIKNTQSMATSGLTRVTISDNSNGRLNDIGGLKVADLSAANGTSKTAANAEFSYNTEVTFTKDHTPAIMSGKYTATPYTWNNSTYANGKAEGSFAGERYLWNGIEGTENDKTSSFHIDGKRLAYTVLTKNGNVTGLDLTSTATYEKATSLIDGGDYAQQLLVQGGELKHPGGSGCDVTGTYTSANCTGTRYWTKLIKTDANSGDAHTVFTITGSNMTNSGVKLWAVCANTDNVATAGQKVVLLNATSANGGVATNLSASSITVEIKGGVMTCKKNSTFYLVVELPANSTTKLGAITVANG
jgi:hypothetical protein